MASKTIQSEIINPKIAKLLGLDFTGDLDREDYISLLKEYIISAKMNILGSSSKYKTEDVEAVTNEFKEIKKTKPEIKFTVKRTKVSKENLLGRKKGSSLAMQKSLQSPTIEPDKLLPDGFKNKKQSVDHFAIIIEKLDSIIKTLDETNELKKEQEEEDRKNIENKKRNKRENKIESGPLKTIKDTAEKTLKPIMSIWEKVFNFIKTVFLGRVLFKLVEWFGNKENQGKLNAIGSFLENTWPALLAGFIIFGTGLGSVVGGLISMVTGFIPKLGGIIKSLLLFVKSNPLLFGAAAVATAATAMIAANQDETAVVKDPKDPDKSQADEIRQYGAMTASPMSGDMFSDLPKETPQKYNKGGMVPGSGPNKDTVPAMLSPGEIVMSRSAVEKYGSDTLLGMNASVGSTNNPKIVNGIQYVNQGGIISGSGPNKDTVPVMLSPGEFVMSRGAVQKYGVDTMESMNAMGGGTNIPILSNSITYAVGGGTIDGGRRYRKNNLSQRLSESTLIPTPLRSIFSTLIGHIENKLFNKSSTYMTNNDTRMNQIENSISDTFSSTTNYNSKINLGKNIPNVNTPSPPVSKKSTIPKLSTLSNTSSDMGNEISRQQSSEISDPIQAILSKSNPDDSAKNVSLVLNIGS